MNNKSKFILVGVTVVVCVILIIFLLTQNSGSQRNLSNSSAALPSPVSGGAANISINTNQGSGTNAVTSPQDVTKTFYTWYLSYPKDVVATGAYKTNPYLTGTFKKTIANFVKSSSDPAYDPIFCSANKTSDVMVSQFDYNADTNQATMLIQKNSTSDSPPALYRVILKQINDKWMIDDIICIPQ